MSRTSTDAGTPPNIVRFGVFELDIAAERLLKNGRTVRLQPQPFKLLTLLVGCRGQLVTREQIRTALWSGDTFVDVEQGVNFAIKQIREALGEDADHPLYIQTVPRRGYRFLAPVDAISGEQEPGTDLSLHKALWTNIADLRLAEEQRARRRKVLSRLFIVVGAAGGDRRGAAPDEVLQLSLTGKAARGRSNPSFLQPLLRTSSEGCALVNRRTGLVLADQLIRAFDSATRRKGLLHHGALPQGSAMIIAPSNAIHTFFMKFPIDVAFVGRDGLVRKVCEAVRPWRICATLRAYAAIELPVGAIRSSNTVAGDMLVIRSAGDEHR